MKRVAFDAYQALGALVSFALLLLLVLGLLWETPARPALIMFGLGVGLGALLPFALRITENG